MEQTEIDLLLDARKKHRESYVIHNRKVCDDVYSQVLGQSDHPDVQLTSIQPKATAQISNLSPTLIVKESISNFSFVDTFLQGTAYFKDEVYGVGNGSGENYVAFRYSTHVKANSTIQAIVTLYVYDVYTIYDARALEIALYRDGQATFEGTKQMFTCRGGVESFTVQAQFLHKHPGVRVQIGCDELREVKFSLIDVKLEYL